MIIVSWNGREDTLRAVESVTSQIGRGELQAADVSVTVVDNGSTDGTSDALTSHHPSVSIRRLPENRGFTGGIGEGVARSSAKYLIFLNNDAVAEPGWLHHSVQAMRAAADDVIGIGGKIIDMEGRLVDFIGGVLTFDGHAFQTSFREPLSETQEPLAGAELLFACGGNMIVRREAFVGLGGFDDDYFAYLEDVDFGWRSWLSGWRIIYNPSAVVRHKSAATSDRIGIYERGLLFERNALQTAVKNYDEELFGLTAGSLFLTLLHRLHYYVLHRSQDAEALRKPPIGGQQPGPQAPRRGRLATMAARVRRKLTRRPGVVIDDPLAIMQFRAIDWFFQNLDHIIEKRRTVQKLRRRSDREIFAKFPVHYIPTYPGDEELMRSPLFELLKPSIRSEEKRLEDIMRR